MLYIDADLKATYSKWNYPVETTNLCPVRYFEKISITISMMTFKVTLNLFLIFSACLVNDINIFDYTVLLLALIAAETAMALSLIIGSRGFMSSFWN